jgi:hypothetical protein
MKDIMDTVDPGFWPRWKKTRKRVDTGDGVHVIRDYCGQHVTLIRPIEFGLKVMCEPCNDALFLEFVEKQRGEHANI